MPRLTVPPEQREALAALYQLSGPDLSQFIGAIESAQPRMYSSQLAADVATRVPSIAEDVVRSIVESLWQIDYMRFALEAPREPFMDDVAAAIAATGVAPDLDRFMQIVDRLLESPAIRISTKARSLLTDGNSYCRSRVLTDVRPVFGSGIEGAPDAALVVHHLTISYHGGSAELADVVVSLDSDDIENLIETLRRAQAKQQRLKALIQAAKVPYLDAE